MSVSAPGPQGVSSSTRFFVKGLCSRLVRFLGMTKAVDQSAGER